MSVKVVVEERKGLGGLCVKGVGVSEKSKRVRRWRPREKMGAKAKCQAAANRVFKPF
jgi:hypothetical protein